MGKNQLWVCHLFTPWAGSVCVCVCRGRAINGVSSFSLKLKGCSGDFPGGTVVKNRPAKSACQCRGHGFNPWSGKIPHTAEQLSPCATTTEPAL